MRTAAVSTLVIFAVACGAGSQGPSAPQCPELPAPPVVDAPATLSPASDELAKLARLEGDWRGEGHGEPGDATVERSYRWVLGGKYLESRSRSTYAPQTKNPDGEVHEDVGYYSHDKGRKVLVVRQFHVEGFVNQYILESSTADTFVFMSEAIENIPAGFRARETLRFVSDDQLEETFEIAPPNGDFSVYSTSTLARVKAAP